MNNFTFKKRIPTGRYRAFELDYTEIKLQKKEVGYIAENRDHEYRVGFAVKKEPTKEEPAGFKWMFLKVVFPDETKARTWVKEHADQIQRRFDLHQFED